MTELPRGTVSFLFTDIEASTRLWQDHARAMPAAYARHDAILRAAVGAYDGVVYKVVGDALQVAFDTAPRAVAAAIDAQQGLLTEDWAATGLTEPLRVRMALHTVAVAPDADGDYRTPGLNRLGRLLATAAGGQVLLSGVTADLAHDHLPPGGALRDLGPQRLKDIYRPEHVYELVTEDVPTGAGPAPGQAPAKSWLRRNRRQERFSVAVAAIVVCAVVASVLGYLGATDRLPGQDDARTTATEPDPGPGSVLLQATFEDVAGPTAYLGIGYLDIHPDDPNQNPTTLTYPGPIALYCVCGSMAFYEERPPGVEIKIDPPTIWIRDSAIIKRAPTKAGEVGLVERTSPGEYVPLHAGDQVAISANNPFVIRTGMVHMPEGGMGGSNSFVIVGMFPLPAPSPVAESGPGGFPDWIWRTGGVLTSLPNGPAEVTLRRIRLESGDSVVLDGAGPVVLFNEGLAMIPLEEPSDPGNLTLAIAHGSGTITHPPDYLEPVNATPDPYGPPQITVVVRPPSQATPGGETILPASSGAVLETGVTGSVRNNGRTSINLLLLTVAPA